MLISLRSFRRPFSHGFYRFFAWEAILVLFLMNVDSWFRRPFSLLQIFSWLCLSASLFLLIHSVQPLKLRGKPTGMRRDAALFGVEKTTHLVTTGAYHYIRHPLYSSLLLLAWGIFFKSPSWPGAALVGLATAFLTWTAMAEERENQRYFGAEYQQYMRSTKRFIPYIF